MTQLVECRHIYLTTAFSTEEDDKILEFFRQHKIKFQLHTVYPSGNYFLANMADTDAAALVLATSQIVLWKTLNQQLQ